MRHDPSGNEKRRASWLETMIVLFMNFVLCRGDCQHFKARGEG